MKGSETVLTGNMPGGFTLVFNGSRDAKQASFKIVGVVKSSPENIGNCDKSKEEVRYC